MAALIPRSLFAVILCRKSRLLSQCNKICDNSNNNSYYSSSQNRRYASRMSSKLPLQSSSLSSPGSPSRSRQYSSNSRKGRESVKEQAFEYFVILDFEGTCESNRQLESVEIIEFPALLIQVKNEMQIKDQFHSFVRPTINEQLSGFCVNLTGITQETVDESPTFTQVFQAFQDWMKEKKLVDRLTNQPLIPFAFITCGNWDLSTALTDQCQQQQLLIPGYMKQWIDFKQEFFRFSGQWPKGLMDMMHRRNLTPIGRHHSGIDDCRNLHLLVKDLASNGHVFRITNQMR